jgi:hypothetical protein
MNILDYIPRSEIHSFGLKYLNSLMRMQIRESFWPWIPDPGYGMEKIRILDGKNWDPGWKKFGFITIVVRR